MAVVDTDPLTSRAVLLYQLTFLHCVCLKMLWVCNYLSQCACMSPCKEIPRNNHHFSAARWANTAVESLTIHTRALLRKQEWKTSSSQWTPSPFQEWHRATIPTVYPKHHVSEAFLGENFHTLKQGKFIAQIKWLYSYEFASDFRIASASTLWAMRHTAMQ